MCTSTFVTHNTKKTYTQEWRFNQTHSFTAFSVLQPELYPSQIRILKSLSLLPQNVSFFGDEAFKDKVKWAIYTGLEWTLVPSGWCTVSKCEQTKRRDTKDLHTQSICGHREKVAIPKSRQEDSGETNYVGTLILDF